MSEAVIIQPAGYDHPDAVELTRRVQQFYLQLYGGTDESPMTPEEFTPPQGQFLLGYLDHQAVAMGGWRFLPAGTTEFPRSAELKRMYVQPEVRGRGLGLEMLRALEHSAAVAGADWVVLQTGQPQVEALGLYRSAGYHEVRPFGFFACQPSVLHLGRRLETSDGSRT